jgi:hypothetical protein
MHEDRTEVHVENGAPRWVGIAVAVLAIVSLGALGVGWSATNRAKAAETSAATQTQSVAENNAMFAKRLEAAEATNAQLQANLGVITDRLKLTQTELTRARANAKQITAQYNKNLDEMQTAIRNDLAGKASAEDLKTLGTGLSGDIAGVRGDLESTRKDLGMARGELGTLIARNGEEIEQLRRLGQRDYLEFTLDRKGDREKVGNVTVELRGANVKKSQFSVYMWVDDKRIEKKNRAANEPIYFYTRGSRQPLELVVNEVSKNKITGYVSVPKSVSAPSTGGGQ